MIRPAEAADRNAIAALVGRYWAHDGIDGFDAARVSADLGRLLADPKLGTVLVAVDGGTLIGYVVQVYVFSLEHRGLTAEIDELFVSEDRRGTGVGAALLRSAEARARERGCRNLSLQLASENDSARIFYRHVGFEERAAFELLEKDLRSG